VLNEKNERKHKGGGSQNFEGKQNTNWLISKQTQVLLD